MHTIIIIIIVYLCQSDVGPEANCTQLYSYIYKCVVCDFISHNYSIILTTEEDCRQQLNHLVFYCVVLYHRVGRLYK